MSKKQFNITNPAEQFITAAHSEPTPAPTTTQKIMSHYTTAKSNIRQEARSRRMQILLQPSLFEAIKQEADTSGFSVNELIHSTLQAAFQKGDNAQ